MAKTPASRSSKNLTSPGPNSSMSIRKISNGYLITESKSTRNGFTQKETFSKVPPKIVVKP